MRLVADENFDKKIVDAVLRENPDIDFVRVQNIGMGGKSDPEVLEWAAGETRLVITHDVNTMPDFAYQRIRASQAMPGVIVAPQEGVSRGTIIDDIILIAESGEPSDFDQRVVYLPLK